MSNSLLSDYNAATKLLSVGFTVYRKSVAPLSPSGKPYRYHYFNVPVAVADTFILDRENGEYYNANIRGKFAFYRES